MDLNTYVEEKQLSFVTTLVHMIVELGTCEDMCTWLEK